MARAAAPGAALAVAAAVASTLGSLLLSAAVVQANGGQGAFPSATIAIELNDTCISACNVTMKAVLGDKSENQLVEALLDKGRCSKGVKFKTCLKTNKKCRGGSYSKLKELVEHYSGLCMCTCSDAFVQGVQRYGKELANPKEEFVQNCVVLAHSVAHTIDAKQAQKMVLDCNLLGGISHSFEGTGFESAEECTKYAKALGDARTKEKETRETFQYGDLCSDYYDYALSFQPQGASRRALTAVKFPFGRLEPLLERKEGANERRASEFDQRLSAIQTMTQEEQTLLWVKNSYPLCATFHEFVKCLRCTTKREECQGAARDSQALGVLLEIAARCPRGVGMECQDYLWQWSPENAVLAGAQRSAPGLAAALAALATVALRRHA